MNAGETEKFLTDRLEAEQRREQKICETSGYKNKFKTKTSSSRRRRIVQILERCQSLLQQCNVVQIARLVFNKTMDPTLHYKMKTDEAYDKTGERPQPRYVHGDPMQTRRHLHRNRNRNRNRQLSVLIVNIETDAQTE